MAEGIGVVSEYATTVVRLFPDHAGSAIWFSSPLPYEESQLDAPLIADLRAWEDRHHDGLDSDYEWRTPELETHFHADGARLARRLADQIGDDFQVQYELGGSHRRIRGVGPARNPDAAAVFHRLADTAREEWSRLRKMVDQAAEEGHALGWRAD